MVNLMAVLQDKLDFMRVVKSLVEAGLHPFLVEAVSQSNFEVDDFEAREKFILTKTQPQTNTTFFKIEPRK